MDERKDELKKDRKKTSKTASKIKMEKLKVRNGQKNKINKYR